MIGTLKNFIKKNFLNDNHPMIMRLFWERKARKFFTQQERHSRMTYAEIEKEISRRFEKVFGRKLDWDNPQTYNEKIHVSKVYMPTPLKTRLADKVLVRDWITEKIGGDYLIPLLGVYDSFDQINFDALPNQFVIKCNHDSGSYTLVRDKSKMDKKFLRRKYDILMRRNFAWMGWEMHYRDIKIKLVVEKYIDNAAVNDYRFYCFDGKPYYCAIDFYDDAHQRNARNVYGMDWDLQPFMLHYPNYKNDVPCPKNFDEMKKIAEKLCEGFGHVRVDLYSAGEKIYFGEMTFTHANGFQDFIPDEYDYKLGALWPFDNSIRKKVLAEHSRP